MRKFCLLFFFVFLASLHGYSKTLMKQVFIDMPDSLFPYLTRNNRLDCIDFIESKMKAEIKNKFDENSELVSLTDDYLKFRLNENCTYEMKLLTVAGDTLQRICLIRSYSAPEVESDISFYSQDWKRLDNGRLIIMPTFNSFWHRPDTMSVDKFAELRRYIDPVMMSAAFVESGDMPTIQFSVAQPLLNKEDKKLIKPAIVQINVKWNGSIFK